MKPLLIEPEEWIYVCFHQEDGPGFVRKFCLNMVVSHIDWVTDQLIITPYNTDNGLYDGSHVKRRLIADYKHTPEDRCAVWRYMFYTQWPHTRCVRYTRVSYPKEVQDRFGTIAVSSIEEFGV